MNVSSFDSLSFDSLRTKTFQITNGSTILKAQCSPLGELLPASMNAGYSKSKNKRLILPSKINYSYSIRKHGSEITVCRL